jgi:hypothetical protein
MVRDDRWRILTSHNSVDSPKETTMIWDESFSRSDTFVESNIEGRPNDSSRLRDLRIWDPHRDKIFRTLDSTSGDVETTSSDGRIFRMIRFLNDFFSFGQC